MELSINNIQYLTSSKLDVYTQLHIARKLGSVLPIVDGLTNSANATKDKALATLLMLGQISDADTEYVMKKCLAIVIRRQGNTPSKIQSPDGQLMFADIPLDGLLQLTVGVIEENLGDFFRTALARLGQGAEAQT